MSKSKLITYSVMVASGAFLMLQFQNCSQTQFSKSLDGEASKAASTQDVSIDPVVSTDPGEPCVVVTDPDNNIVLIERDKDPVPLPREDDVVPVVPVKDPVKDPNSDSNVVTVVPVKDPVKDVDGNVVTVVPVKDPIKVPDRDVSNDEDSIDSSESLSCGERSKKYKNNIDISKLTGGKISYLRGNNFLYSSTGYSKFDNVEIDNANGRTILCGVHIRLIKMKVGRLELIRSTVDVIEKQSGVIRQDTASRINQLN